MIVGHIEARIQLENPARVTLIEGPEGVGKRLLAREAAEQAASGTIIEVGYNLCTRQLAGVPHVHDDRCSVLTERVATQIKALAQFRRAFTFIFDAGRIVKDARNSLLKVLEEPPEGIMFLMYASNPVPPTIRSRASLVRVGALADEEVIEVLESLGVSTEMARVSARLSSGRVSRALAVQQMVGQKGVVIQMLKAATNADRALVSQITAGLSPHSDEEWAEIRREGDLARGKAIVSALRQALTEARLGTYIVFTPNELYGLQLLSPPQLDFILRTCGSPARSALVVRVALERLVRCIEH